VIQSAVVPYFGRFTNDDAHTMVDEKALSYLCTRMNLNTR
jgi:hypothetical protein